MVKMKSESMQHSGNTGLRQCKGEVAERGEKCAQSDDIDMKMEP